MIKVISIVFLVVFLVFAILQFNDPDPIVWIAIYVLIAMVSLLRLLGRLSKRVVLGVLIVLIAISFFYLPGLYEWLSLPDKAEIFGEMAHEKPYIEETREFFGLLMGIASVVFHYKTL